MDGHKGIGLAVRHLLDYGHKRIAFIGWPDGSLAGDDRLQGYLDTMRFSQWLNLAGFPGASVPISFSAEGLPIGAQIIGRPYDDELVLSISEILESVRGPFPTPSLL